MMYLFGNFVKLFSFSNCNHHAYPTFSIKYVYGLNSHISLTVEDIKHLSL